MYTYDQKNHKIMSSQGGGALAAVNISVRL